ncbi:lysosomal alpha-mannosidase-like [Amphiura filiformis]|uniref:lysosomal alpha-mannosidase-like n=1 Tax=Amphiura filiformis TaxID=82378 RepID=UPI003B2193F5
MTDVKSGMSTSVRQSFYYYVSSEGDSDSSQGSGAYIFRPNSTEPVSLCVDKLISFEVLKGDISHEIHQQCTSWLSQVIRVYKDERAAEFEWTVGPIPYKDKVGKEIITRFDTDIANNGTFYTDANGRQILKRIRNHRDTWIYLSEDPISGNYYPVNSRIFINDTTGRQLTILSDRSQGGSSITDGTLELMIHRRIFGNDDRGADPLNETGQFGDGLLIRGSHYVMLTMVSEAAKEHRSLAERLYMATTPMFTENNVKDWHELYKTSQSFMTRELPANIHLLTLEVWNETNLVLLRLEHQYEIGEDIELSKAATVSLKDLFTIFDVKSATEMTLSVNQVKNDAKRLQWRSLKHPEFEDLVDNSVDAESIDINNITLTPFQIRTFLLIVQKR